jgi:hypothetical protein
MTGFDVNVSDANQCARQNYERLSRQNVMKSHDSALQAAENENYPKANFDSSL